MMRLKAASCFMGEVMVVFPPGWLEEFDTERDFGGACLDAYIRFPRAGAFRITISYQPRLTVAAKRMSTAEIERVSWRGFGSPWECYRTAAVFGGGVAIMLHEIEG